MDSAVLKKRLSTYRTEGGRLTRVNDELLIDILKAWEVWGGSSRDFYQGLGISKQQLGCMIKKAKKLSKQGVMGDFKEIKLDSLVSATPGYAMELCWDSGRVIRFFHVDHLVDFLKKVA